VADTLVINANLTGISAPNNVNTLTAYPNPAKDHLEINCGNYASMIGYPLKIVNAAAQTVYTTAINQQILSIKLSTWSGAGTYILYILDAASGVVATKEIVLL
jgi:hypothetical protein